MNPSQFGEFFPVLDAVVEPFHLVQCLGLRNNLADLDQDMPDTRLLDGGKARPPALCQQFDDMKAIRAA